MNYYEALSVSTTAPVEVIKVAYKAMLKKCHPDVFRGDKKTGEELTKYLNTAYEVLCDDGKRKVYDIENLKHQQVAHQTPPRQDSNINLGILTRDKAKNVKGPNIDIPFGYSSIGERAFALNATMTSVTIPSSVKSIGNHAFFRCENLASVIIPDSVTNIGEWSFALCENLASMPFPDSIGIVGKCAFEGCASLTSIAINGPKNIGGSAFNRCENLIVYTTSSYVEAYCFENGLNFQKI